MSSTRELPLTADVAVVTMGGGTGGTPFYQYIDESPVNMADYIFSTPGGSSSLECSIEPAPSAVSVESLKITTVTGVAPSDASTGQEFRLWIRRGGVVTFDSTQVCTKPPTPRTWTIATDPKTGLPWTTGGLQDVTVGIDLDATTGGFATCFQIIPSIVFVGAPVQLESSRIIASQQLRLRRFQPRRISIDLPLVRADAEILSDVAISHRDLAWASAGQRGVNPWERILLRVLRQTPDYLEMRTTLSGLDLRSYITTLWDTLRSDEDPSTLYQGVARLNAGGGRVFERDGFGWIPSPVAQSRGLVRVIRLLQDAEKTLFDGTLIESVAVNNLLRSSAVSGATGYTDSGASGSWATAPTTDPLFDSTITPNVIVSTAGSPHSADLVRRFPDTASITGATFVSVQVDHKDDTGAALGWILQRLVDNWYWNATSVAWQAGTVTNLMPVVTEWQQNPSKLGVFSVGAGATVLRFSIVIPSGGTSARKNRIAHVQIGSERWYASRIVTNTATVTTVADDVTYENNTGKRSHSAAQYSSRVTVIPSWNSADQASGQVFVVWEVYHDANNFEYLAYDTTAGAWVHVHRAAGTTTTSSKVLAVVAGTVVRLGSRLCGVSGEWGLSAYTHSVFVDGVKGTDATAAAAMTETSPSTLRIGRNNAGNYFRGRIYEIDFSPFVWSDDEFVDA